MKLFICDLPNNPVGTCHTYGDHTPLKSLKQFAFCTWVLLSLPGAHPCERSCCSLSTRSLAWVSPLKLHYKRCLSIQTLNSEEFKFQIWAPNRYTSGTHNNAYRIPGYVVKRGNLATVSKLLPATNFSK